MKTQLLICALLSLAFINGCSLIAPSPSAKKTASNVHIPNVGSYLTYTNSLISSTGGMTNLGQNTVTYVATDVTYGGFSDVVMTVATTANPNVNDTSYLRYLSNGDISHSSTPAVDPALQQWFTIPYGSQTAFSDNYGGAISSLGFTHDTVTFNDNFVDTTSFTISGKSYTENVVSSTTWENLSGSVKDSTYTITQTTSFIPGLGVNGDHDVTTYTINGTVQSRLQQKLIGVLLK